MADRTDDGWDTFCVTDTDTHTDTHTDTDARTFFSRHLMVCRGRFTIGPFGAIILLKRRFVECKISNTGND